MNCVTPSGPGCPRGVGGASKSVLKLGGSGGGQSGETWGRDPCVIRDNGSSQERGRETKKRVMEGKRGKCHIQDPNFNQVLWLLFSFVCRGGKIQGGGGRKWEREGGKERAVRRLPLPRPWGRDLCKQNARLAVVPGEGGAHRPPPLPSPADDKDGVIHSFGRLPGRTGERQLLSTLGSSVWTPGSFGDFLVEVSQPAGGPAPPGLPWVSQSWRWASPLSSRHVPAAPCSVYMSVLVLPLNGGKQTFWEGIQRYGFTECQAFGWQIEINLAFFLVFGNLHHGACQ